jgi:uncharacterized protein
VHRFLKMLAASAAGIAVYSPYPANVDAQQPAVSIEKLSFTAETAFEPGAAVSGELRIPESKRDRLPAVLILHSSVGIDGTGASYAEALNQAGIATLEIEMWRLADGGGRPVSTRFTMPHAYGSLLKLSDHPRIDPDRIGVMGFSWGGIMSGLTSSAALTQQYTGEKARFAAHLALYPVCWSHSSVLAGEAKYFGPDTYRKVTGKPVHFLAGDKDDYDDPDGCSKFVAALPENVRQHFSLTVYPGATHGWDRRYSGVAPDRAANKGKGGYVNFIATPDIAKRSREFAVAFFTRHLAQTGN